MNTEQKCTSRELSQALDRAGVKVPSERVWLFHRGTGEISFGYNRRDITHACNKNSELLYDYVKAYDTDELLEVLPDSIDNPKRGFMTLSILKTYDGYIAMYNVGCGTAEYRAEASLLSDCLTLLLLKLIEEKLVEV